MVSLIRDAEINGMVEELLAPPPKAQFTIKKKVAICKATSLFGASMNIYAQDYNAVEETKMVTTQELIIPGN